MFGTYKNELTYTLTNNVFTITYKDTTYKFKGDSDTILDKLERKLAYFEEHNINNLVTEFVQKILA